MQNILKLANNTAVKQVIFLASIALSVATGIVVYNAVREPVWVPLDYQINNRNMALISKTLSDESIPYKINNKNGALLVDNSYADAARIKLASAGVPKDDGAGFSFLDEKNGFSDVRFMDNARYLRAMESDLARTITSIRGITGAKVHIAVPEENIFSDENRKVTASVVIEVAGQFSGESDKVNSVMQIIADSVPGLDPKNVSVSDQYGHLLSNSLSSSQVYSSAQLDYQNKIQSYYEKRIMGLITPLVGKNGVNVRVNANIDFTRQENAEESYDPDKKAILSEKQSSEESGAGAASGPPGALSNTPPSDGGASKSSNSSGSSSVGRKESTVNYEISKTYIWKKADFAKLMNLSVAVVVDDQLVRDPTSSKMIKKPLDKTLTDKINGLVKAAIGYNSTRGDQVVVINSSFAPPIQDLAIAPDKIWNLPWFWDLVKKISGIIFGFILLIFLIKNVSKAGASVASSIGSSTRVDEVSLPLSKIREFKDDGIFKVRQLATEDPSKVADILKKWIEK